MSRILAAAALLALVAAGCGSAARSWTSAVHGVPRALAADWEGRASAVEAAASAGDSCQALRLARSLRADVIAKKRRVPLRLRRPLLAGVNSLARRITCTPVVTPQPLPRQSQPPPKGPKPRHGPKPKPPKQHGPHGHGNGHGKGHGK